MLTYYFATRTADILIYITGEKTMSFYDINVLSLFPKVYKAKAALSHFP